VEGVKHCKKCGEVRVGARCKPCTKARQAAYHVANRDTHRDKLNANNAAYHAANRDKRLAQMATYNATHREEKQANDRARRKANPGQKRANDANRRARKLQACPEWLTEGHHKEMDQTHKNCPKGSHVDHIIPLKSEVVQGLHVPWNLQHLTASENRAKSNKCDGTYENNSWRKLK